MTEGMGPVGGANDERGYRLEMLREKLLRKVGRYGPDVFCDARDGPDVVQDAYVIFVRIVDSQESNANITDLLPRILRCCALNHLRRERLTDARRERWALRRRADAEDDPSPLHGLLAKETTDRLADAVRRLPRLLQLVVLQIYFESRTVGEVSEQLQYSERTVHKLKNIALEQLRCDLGDAD